MAIAINGAPPQPLTTFHRQIMVIHACVRPEHKAPQRDI